MPNLVDPHVHLWRSDQPWHIRPPDAMRREFGNLDRLPDTFEVSDYREQVFPIDVSKFICVGAAMDPQWTRPEYDWLYGQHCAGTGPAAFTATADGSAPDRQIAEWIEYENDRSFMRSIRFGQPPDFRTASGNAAADMLVSRGWLLEVGTAFGGGHDVMLALAQQRPDVTIVVQHSARPSRAQRGDFSSWASQVKAIADCPNTYCKLSGLGMTFHETDPEAFGRYWRHLFDSFGAARCMFASNFPIDFIYGSFPQHYDAFIMAMGDISVDDLDLMLGATAEGIYRI